MRRYVLLLVMLAAVAPASAMMKMPLAPGRAIFTISKVSFFSEPFVAIDEHEPSHAVVAYQVGPNIAYTRDGGATWHHEDLHLKRYRVDGDVSVAYARHHAYVCYIAFDELGRDQYWAHGATRNGVYVRRSSDGGKTWEAKSVAVIAHSGHPKLFEDKPILFADDTSSKYRGNLYAGWTEFRVTDAQILFSRSSDGGRTFSKPMRISTHNGTPRDDNGTVEGFDGAVDSDGTIYAVWQDGSHIIFTSSSDGGRSFAPSVPIIDIPAANFTLDGLSERTANGFPQIDVDPRTHRLFLAWSDTRDGGSDVFLAWSDDHGKTWSRHVRVNDDPAYDGADHFYDWMRVDHATGDVYVIFYDRRGDRDNELATVTLARSTNEGRTFTNYAWTTQGFDPNWQFIGDYNALAVYRGRAYGAWTETQALPKDAARRMTERQLEKPRTYVRVGEARF